jgi:hypothetical protein
MTQETTQLWQIHDRVFIPWDRQEPQEARAAIIKCTRATPPDPLRFHASFGRIYGDDWRLQWLVLMGGSHGYI